MQKRGEAKKNNRRVRLDNYLKSMRKEFGPDVQLYGDRAVRLDNEGNITQTLGNFDDFIKGGGKLEGTPRDQRSKLAIEKEKQAEADKNRGLLEQQMLQQGYGQAQQLAGQAFDQQRGLASLQPSLVAANVQQLGGAGTAALGFNQALLDAAQQRAQLAYQEPISRLNVLGSGLASQAGGIPISTQTTQPGAGGGVGPLSQALQTGLTAYGLGSIFGGK